MRYSEEEKTKRLEDWRQSGQSAWAYAKANGLNARTFKKWTKLKTETNHSFVEVPINQVSTHVISPIMKTPEILIERGDVKIHIPLLLNQFELRSVMEGLGAIL